MMIAVRQMKQEWPTKAGSAIRNAISKEQENYPSNAECIVYDVSIRNVFDYDQSKNQIKVSLYDSTF